MNDEKCHNSRTDPFTVGTTNYLCDGNGNLTNWWYKTFRSTNSITNIFDDENRLVWVSTTASLAEQIATSFAYDGLGRLREQLQWTNNAGSGGQSPELPTNGWTVVGGIAYIYDGSRVIEERDLNNNPLVAYTRGNDLSGTLEGAGGIGGLLARSDGYSSGTFSEHDFYHADGNGNITYLVNSAQTLAASYRYDPFGNLISSSGTLAPTNTYRFSSKEYIPTVGAYYYLYRFYNPGIQRWMSRDPIGEIGGLNLYSCVGNNPVIFLDGFGLDFNLTGNPVIDAGLEGYSRAAQGIANAFTGGLFDPEAGLFYDSFNNQWDDMAEGSNTGDSSFNTGENAGRVAVTCLATAGAIRAAGLSSKIAVHGPHHSFGWLGRLWHLQANWWRAGAKGSGGVFRIPLPWK